MEEMVPMSTRPVGDGEMKISVESLKKMGACEEGIEEFKKLFGDKEVDAIQALLKFAKLEPRYSIWWLTETFSKEHNVKLAIYSAELVLHIFEDKYPDDDRPRKAIEAAKEYLKNPTEDNRNASYAAAAASSAAAYASSASSSSASSSASSAAYSAAVSYFASSASSSSASSAAYDAEYEKAKSETYLKIIKYGIKLLKGTEK